MQQVGFFRLFRLRGHIRSPLLLVAEDAYQHPYEDEEQDQGDDGQRYRHPEHLTFPWHFGEVGPYHLAQRLELGLDLLVSVVLIPGQLAQGGDLVGLTLVPALEVLDLRLHLGRQAFSHHAIRFPAPYNGDWLFDQVRIDLFERLF